MKIVSFETAKAIKEVGYPQGETDKCFDSKGVLHYTSSTDSWLLHDIYIDVPTYLDVWLWLWREKKIRIEFGDMVYKIYDATEWVDNYGYHLIDLSNNLITDPEEAIIAAIEYLVDNNLIK